MTIWETLKRWAEGDERELWCSPRPELSHAPAPPPPGTEPVKTQAEENDRFNHLYPVCCLVTLCALLAVLLIVVFHMPVFGDPANPTNNELPRYYIENGLREGGGMNLVSDMILSYRVFDTFGESCVLFLAATSVTMLLARDRRDVGGTLTAYYETEDRAEGIAKDRLLRSVTRVLLPVLFLYALYIMLNGHLSPGGGFAGGSVLGGGLILYAQEFGTQGVGRFFSQRLYQGVRVTALAGYGFILLYYAITGANGLDNHIWLGVPGTLLSGGIILPINIMVGFVVTCTIYAFYALFHKGEI
ncbi:MAG: hydrogen gas-evolving membrane-bound hydrogenase subunit E [Candidatus Onthomonas sp.]